MSDFYFHVHVARKVALVISFLFFLITLVLTFDPTKAVLIAMTSYGATIVGGAAPDIDASQPPSNVKRASIPYRYLLRFLTVIIPVSALYWITWQPPLLGPQNASVSDTVVVGVAMVGVVKLPAITHSVMPKHRGKLHSTGFWVITSMAVVFVTRVLLSGLEASGFVRTYVPIAVGIPLLAGSITHITQDKLSTTLKSHLSESARDKLGEVNSWVPKHKPVIVDIPQLGRIIIDKRAPWSIRLGVIFVFLYGLMPLDLIPDAIGPVGWVEDFLLYMNLRESVYYGYHQDVDILTAIKRRVEVIMKFILLGFLAIFIILYYLFIF